MSGVGAPAVRPRTCSAGAYTGSGERRAHPHAWRRRPTNGPICLGLGPQLYVPETVERARRGVRNCTAAYTHTPGGDEQRPYPYVWGWGPSSTSPNL
eukprot:gene11012-biopygen15377